MTRYRGSLENRPQVEFPRDDPGFNVPGYPQMMQGQEWTAEEMKKIDGRQAVRGMRKKWHMGVKGLMTVVRVLPDDLYNLVMNSDEKLKPGQVFEELKRRTGKGGGKERT